MLMERAAVVDAGGPVVRVYGSGSEEGPRSVGVTKLGRFTYEKRDMPRMPRSSVHGFGEASTVGVDRSQDSSSLAVQYGGKRRRKWRARREAGGWRASHGGLR
jgi:hypothetical protein